MRGKNTKRRTRRLKQRRSGGQKRSMYKRSMYKRSGGQKRSMQKRTLRRKYKLRGGNPAPVPASSSAPPPNTSLTAPPAQQPLNHVVKMSATDGARQNDANRALAGGGSCPEGVPHGKIEVPQFKLTGVDGPINANTNMVGLATTYAVAQTNATNDSLVKV